jgi:hypothetical protein
VADFDASLLDPATWKEPVELIPVRIKTSEFRWSNPKYNAATEFRPAFPETGKGEDGHAIQQWAFELERLDAKYALLDGSEAPVIIYAGVDLQGYHKQRDGSYILESVMKGRGKPQRVITEWVKAAGSLVPDPTRLEGQIWMVKFFRQMELGPGFFAKKVTLPDHPLPPTYVFDGTMQTFAQTAKAAAEGDSASGDGPATFSNSETLDPTVAANLIGAFIRDNGFTELNSSVLGNAAFPAGCRMEPFVSAFVRGNVAEVLAGFGVEIG